MFRTTGVSRHSSSIAPPTAIVAAEAASWARSSWCRDRPAVRRRTSNVAVAPRPTRPTPISTRSTDTRFAGSSATTGAAHQHEHEHGPQSSPPSPLRTARSTREPRRRRVPSVPFELSPSAMAVRKVQVHRNSVAIIADRPSHRIGTALATPRGIIRSGSDQSTGHLHTTVLPSPSDIRDVPAFGQPVDLNRRCRTRIPPRAAPARGRPWLRRRTGGPGADLHGGRRASR